MFQVHQRREVERCARRTTGSYTPTTSSGSRGMKRSRPRAGSRCSSTGRPSRTIATTPISAPGTSTASWRPRPTGSSPTPRRCMPTRSTRRSVTSPWTRWPPAGARMSRHDPAGDPRVIAPRDGPLGLRGGHALVLLGLRRRPARSPGRVQPGAGSRRDAGPGRSRRAALHPLPDPRRRRIGDFDPALARLVHGDRPPMSECRAGPLLRPCGLHGEAGGRVRRSSASRRRPGRTGPRCVATLDQPDATARLLVSAGEPNGPAHRRSPAQRRGESSGPWNPRPGQVIVFGYLHRTGPNIEKKHDERLFFRGDSAVQPTGPLGRFHRLV